MSGLKRRSRRLLLAVLALIVSLAAPGLVTAALIKLSGTMPAFGDVEDFAISRDGRYVVFLADTSADGVFELFSAPFSGGAPIRLSAAAPVAGGNVEQFAISADSSWVVYLADQQTDGVVELYSVPLAGPASAGVKLNGPLVVGSDVVDFQISADSSRVVYRADQQTDGVVELYSVPLAGPASAGVKLNGPLTVGGNVEEFAISPDSSRVVYRADQQTDEALELYSVPLAGPASVGVKLNGPLTVGGNVEEFAISPDSSRVVYRADQQVDGVVELYSVQRAGPASAGVKLNALLVAGGDVEEFAISPDSSRVAYRADQQIDGVVELYSVPLTGPASAGVKLNAPLVAGGDVADFQISADSSRVVYRADQQTDGVVELYSVPLGGSASAGVKLNALLIVGGNVEEFAISADSSRVVYRADQQADGVVELYSVSQAGPASAGVKLNGPLTVGGNVEEFAIAPDSSRVVYRADQQVDEAFELYAVSLVGPASVGVKLNGPLTAGGNVEKLAISSNGRWVVYRADQQVDGVVELYAAGDYTVYLPFVQR